jgi:hypothetical protein
MRQDALLKLQALGRAFWQSSQNMQSLVVDEKNAIWH